MAHLLTLFTEDVFTVIGLVFYAGVVYYMIEKVLRRRFGKRKPKDDSMRSRKNFSKNLAAATTFPDNHNGEMTGS